MDSIFPLTSNQKTDRTLSLLLAPAECPIMPLLLQVHTTHMTENKYSLRSEITSAQSEIVRVLVFHNSPLSVMYKEQKFSLSVELNTNGNI